jgi:hypothetical protein
MKKILFLTAAIALPLLVFAQTGQVLQKDFEKKVDLLTRTFQVNSHLNVAEIMIDQDNFELVAIDDQMKALWRTTFKGSPVASGIFKGQILTVAADASQKSKGVITYSAYLLDVQSGKIILQKLFFTNTDVMKLDCKGIFAKDGSWAKITMRKTGAKNSSSYSTLDKLNETHGFNVFDVDGNLAATNSQPELPDGMFAGFAANESGSYFIFYLQSDGTLKAMKYKNGQNAPVVSISQPLDMRTKGSEGVSYNAIPSESEKDIAYFSIIHQNPQKDYELSVCKLDFNKRVSKLVNEVLSNSHLKAIEKAFIKPDKKLDDANIGSADFLVVKHMGHYDGTLIVTYGADFIKDNYRIQYSSVINGYDNDLNLKYQQVMPTKTVYGPTGDASASFCHNGDKISMTANEGNMLFHTIYGQMDLNTGKWLKLQRLDKDKLDRSDFVTPHNLWYKDNFTLIYVPFKNGVNGKLNFSLQSNPY